MLETTHERCTRELTALELFTALGAKSVTDQSFQITSKTVLPTAFNVDLLMTLILSW